MTFNEDDIIDALTLANVFGEVRQEVLKKLQVLAKEKEEERLANKVPRQSKTYNVVLKGLPEGVDTEALVAAVYVMPESEDSATLFDKIRAAAVDSNLKKKTKKASIKTFSDTMTLKGRFQKDRNFKIITKEWSPVHILKPGQDENFITTQAAKTEDFS